MKVELINFKSIDNIILNGYINKTNSKKVLISTHGMSSNCFKDRDQIICNYIAKNNIDFFGYNNRGSELSKYITREVDGKKIKLLAGTSFEDPLESYYDIKGAIEKAVELGYTDIYLQGHSLGCTKIVYTINKLLEEKYELLVYIKAVILLSLIDIPRVLKIFLNKNYSNVLKFAEEKYNSNKLFDYMPNESFIHPVSVKTFLRYTKYNEEINFANYSNNEDTFEKLNNIKVPLFMRWGNINEMIEQNVEDLVSMMKNKIHIKNDIDYIAGADHGYTGKEEIVASQILNFLNNL